MRHSQRKIEANRRNALSSTGPTSTKGKATAARNAVKHSILAREIIDSDPAHDTRGFEDLLAELTKEYQPVGITETLLVEKIASCWWRLKRVIRAESGEVNKGLVDAYEQHAANSDKQSDEFVKWVAMRAERRLGSADGDVPAPAQIAADEAVIRSLRSTESGISAIGELIRDIKKEVIRQGTLPEGRILFILKCLGFEWLGEVPLNGEFETPDQCKNFLHNLDVELTELDKAAASVRVMRASELKAAILSASLPSEEALHRLLRYETHIDRQLYRAIDQLERTQRLRKGDKVPPPLKLNVEHTRS